MSLKANWRINTGKKIFEPGEIVTGLSKSDQEELLASGAIEQTKKVEAEKDVE